MTGKIALIPGDGIGPEIVAEAKKFLFYHNESTSTFQHLYFPMLVYFDIFFKRTNFVPQIASIIN